MRIRMSTTKILVLLQTVNTLDAEQFQELMNYFNYDTKGLLDDLLRADLAGSTNPRELANLVGLFNRIGNLDPMLDEDTFSKMAKILGDENEERVRRVIALTALTCFGLSESFIEGMDEVERSALSLPFVYLAVDDIYKNPLGAGSNTLAALIRTCTSREGIGQLVQVIELSRTWIDSNYGRFTFEDCYNNVLHRVDTAEQWSTIIITVIGLAINVATSDYDDMIDPEDALHECKRLTNEIKSYLKKSPFLTASGIKELNILDEMVNKAVQELKSKRMRPQ
jgi:hypothetical protein